MYEYRPLTRTQSRRRAFLVGGAALAVLVSTGAIALINRQPTLDEKTLCPQEQKLESSTIVLVDTTDALTLVQTNRLLAAVAEARGELPVYGKLTLLFLDAKAPFDPKELVSLCNPGSPRYANPLFQTASRIEKRYRESFGGPVEKAVEALLKAPTAARSPILEALTAVTWRSDFDARVKNRKLFVVSDLLQLGEGGYSHYQGGDLWVRFVRSGIARKVEADLTDVRVKIDYLRRAEATQHQNDAHRAFWTRWLTERGAATIDFGTTPARARELPISIANGPAPAATKPVR